MKSLRLLSALVLAAGLSLHAEFKRNPDAGTIWIEDGRNIATDPGLYNGKWWNQDALIAPLPDGKGFSLAEKPGSKSYKTLHYVPCNSEYPWMVLHLKHIERTKGYTDFTLHLHGGRSLSQVANPAAGIFAFKMFDKPLKGNVPLSIYVRGVKAEVGYIKAVKEPENYVYAESAAFSQKQFGKGAKIKFTVKLAKPCEDVTIRLYDPYLMLQMSINKQDKIQLQPINDDGRIWTAEVTVDEIAGRPKHSAIMMKAVVLGSEEIKEPLWGKIFSCFR